MISLTSLQSSAIVSFMEKAGFGMIIGIGHDISDIRRIAKLVKESKSKRFLERVLSTGERELASAYSGVRLSQFTAGRFAAKEAVVKAFGCGIGQIIGFSDIEILPDCSGKPECSLSTEAWHRLGLTPDEVRVHVTITHERDLASAFVIVERII